MKCFTFINLYHCNVNFVFFIFYGSLGLVHFCLYMYVCEYVSLCVLCDCYAYVVMFLSTLYLSIYLILHLPVFLLICTCMYSSCYNGPSTQAFHLVLNYHSQTLYYCFSFFV